MHELSARTNSPGRDIEHLCRMCQHFPRFDRPTPDYSTKGFFTAQVYALHNNRPTIVLFLTSILASASPVISMVSVHTKLCDCSLTYDTL